MKQIKSNLNTYPVLIPLKKDFYLRSSLQVAKDLLGKFFTKKCNSEFLIAKIVETEAYTGENDRASHSFNGKTKRNKAMFEEGGILYVYFTYGVHYCANVVTGGKNIGEAVLIRAAEPIAGIDFMALNRYGKKNLSEKEVENLLSGPAKFCKAFGINKNDNEKNLLLNEFCIASNSKDDKITIATSQRIGISKSKDFLWRFYIINNKFVSHTKNQK